MKTLCCLTLCALFCAIDARRTSAGQHQQVKLSQNSTAPDVDDDTSDKVVPTYNRGIRRGRATLHLQVPEEVIRKSILRNGVEMVIRSACDVEVTGQVINEPLQLPYSSKEVDKTDGSGKIKAILNKMVEDQNEYLEIRQLAQDYEGSGTSDPRVEKGLEAIHGHDDEITKLTEGNTLRFEAGEITKKELQESNELVVDRYVKQLSVSSDDIKFLLRRKENTGCLNFLYFHRHRKIEDDVKYVEKAIESLGEEATKFGEEAKTMMNPDEIKLPGKIKQDKYSLYSIQRIRNLPTSSKSDEFKLTGIKKGSPVLVTGKFEARQTDLFVEEPGTTFYQIQPLVTADDAEAAGWKDGYVQTQRIEFNEKADADTAEKLQTTSAEAAVLLAKREALSQDVLDFTEKLESVKSWLVKE